MVCLDAQGRISRRYRVPNSNRRISPKSFIDATPAAITIEQPKLEAYLEAEEAATFVRMAARTLKQRAREGKIPAHPIGFGTRKRWYFLLSELDAWLRSQVNSGRDPERGKRRLS